VGGGGAAVSWRRGGFCFFLDDDAEWHDSGDVARLLEVFQQRPNCGAVAVKSIEGATRQPVLRELPHPNKRYLLEAENPVEVPFFYGVGNALRAEAVQKIGGYRELHFRYSMEDVELSYRLLDAGYKIYYHPHAAVYHHHTPSGRPFEGNIYWVVNTVNKTHMAWRLLPLPYPLTTLLMWSLQTLCKTRRLKPVLQIGRELWRSRTVLRRERQPLKAETVAYLKRIGGRLWY